MMDVLTEFLITIVAALLIGGGVYLAAPRLLAMEGVQAQLARWDPARVKRVSNYAFAGLLFLFVLVFAALAILRHLAFNTGGFDLGIFDQAVWNSLQGRLLEVSIVPDTPRLLGQRFSPILLGLVPLYAIWSDPIVLLVVQTLALGISALPIYWYAKNTIGAPLALAVSLAFFLSPALEHVDLYEFHEVALTAPLFSFATYFLLRRSYKGFLVCLGLALLTKEEIAFSLLAFGAFLFLVQRKRLFGVGLAVFGVLWGLFLLQVAIPYFRGPGFSSGYYYFGFGQAAGTNRYDYLGHSLPEIVTTIVTRPDIWLPILLTRAKIEYTLHLLVPLAFLPVVGAEVGMLALPTLGFSIISTFPFMVDISSHYAAPLLPLTGFATVAGMQRVLGWVEHFKKSRRKNSDAATNAAAWKWTLGALLLAASVLDYVFQAPGPLALHYQPDQYTLNAHTALAESLTRSIPTDAVVVAQAELQAHLSERRLLYEIPRIPDYRQADYVLADKTRPWYDVHKGIWEAFWTTGYFETVVDRDGLIVAKRKPPAQTLSIQFGKQMTLLGYTIVATDTLRGGITLRPAVAWQADQPLTERYKMRVQVQDAAGHVWAEDDEEPDGGNTPTTNWQVGKTVGDQYTLPLPVTMPAGEYQLTLTVHGATESSEDMALSASEGPRPLGNAVKFATVQIARNHDSYTATQLMVPQPLFVDMAEMRFLGYIPFSKAIHPGERLSLATYWRAREKPQGDYTVAVQLRDASGSVALEQAGRPANGTYPTTQWSTGEVLLDWHDLDLPQAIAPGDYKVWVVLRDSTTGKMIGETAMGAISVVH